MHSRHLLLSLLLLLTPAVFGGEALLEGNAFDQHGTVHNLEDLAVGPLVIDFAASWCDPCYKALPKLEALARKHPEVRFVVVSVDETKAGRDRLVRELGLELPVLWDEDQSIVQGFEPDGFPATYVLEEGQIVHRHIGTDEEEWGELVEAVGRARESASSSNETTERTRQP